MADKEDLNLLEVHLYAAPDVPDNYLNIIRSRWKISYKHDNDYMKLVHSQAYYFAYSNYIENILRKPKVDVRFAVLSDDNDVVLGFSVTEGNILHYVHVPKAYRRNGIATMLVPEPVEWFTHLTKTGMRLWSTKAPYAKFNPFIT